MESEYSLVWRRGSATRAEGNEICREQCSLGVPREHASFWYVPVKNHAKLRTKNSIRNRERAEKRAAEAERSVRTADAIPGRRNVDS